MSYLHHTYNSNQSNNAYLFLLSAPSIRDALQTISSNIPDTISENQKGLLLKQYQSIEEYYYKNVMLLKQINIDAMYNLHVQITRSEATRSIGYCENLFSSIVQLKEVISCISEQLVDCTATYRDLSIFVHHANEGESSQISTVHAKEIYDDLNRLYTDAVSVLEIIEELFLMSNKIVSQSMSGMSTSLSSLLETVQTSLKELLSSMSVYLHHDHRPNTQRLYDVHLISLYIQWNQRMTAQLESLLNYYSESSTNSNELLFNRDTMKTIVERLNVLKSRNISVLQKYMVENSSVKNEADLQVLLEKRKSLSELLLLTIQKTISQSAKNSKQYKENEIIMGKQIDLLIQTWKEMKYPTIQKEWNEMIQMMNAYLCANPVVDHDYISKCSSIVSTLLPLFYSYYLLLMDFFSNTVYYTRSLCKLNYVLLKIFREVILKGFCTPKKEEEEEKKKNEENEERNEERDGTGMGEGEGSKDVTDEIENEDQLEGLRNDREENEEEEENKENEEKNKKEGLDMENDFDGELEDLESEEENEEEENDEEEEESEDQDRDMGDAGDDAEVLDEQMWDEKEEKDEDEKFEQDNESHQQNTDEMTTKEEEEKKKEEEEEKKEQKKENVSDQEEADDIEEEINDLNDQEYEDNHYKDMDDNEEEENENNEEEKEEEEEEFAEDMKLDDNEPDHDSLEENEDVDMNELPTEDDYEPEEENEEENGDEEEEEKNDDVEMLGNQDEVVNSDDDMENKNEEENEENNEEEEEEKNENETVPEGLQDENGVDSIQNKEKNKELGSDQKNEEEKEEEENEEEEEEEMKGEDGLNKEGIQEEKTKEEEKKEEEDEMNPYEDKKKTLEKWRERFEKLEIIPKKQQEEEKEEEGMKENEENAEKEKKDLGVNIQQNQSGEEVLAPMEVEMEIENADKEENRIDIENKEEEEEENEEENKDEEMEITKEVDEHEHENENEMEFPEESEDEEMKNEPPAIENTNYLKSILESKEHPDENEVLPDEDNKNAVLRSMDLEYEKMENEEKDYQEMETELKEDYHQDIDVYRDIEVTKEGMELWRLYESQTSDLSTRLCEQLRILLEPLQSSKLSGDYKTGKRINMRKIIPFIASNYKKDKIWLRRTKPSKREYNILIALDDSISMKENGGGVIGLQTMALISKALTQVCFYDMILSVLVGSGSVGRLLVR